MNIKIERMSAWSGLVFLLTFFIGWAVLARYLPPPSPGASAEEIARFYNTDTNLLRVGLLVVQGSCMFYIPWVAVISARIKRIPGVSPVCTYTQALGGIMGMLALILPYYFWAAASFRPERDAALIQLLNDMGWLIFVMTFAPFVIQNVAIAFATLSDRRAQPLFPRWVAYFNLWIAFLFLPAGLALFFKAGPFSWRGLITFWVPLAAFSVWLIGMLVLMLRSIGRDAEARAA